MGKAGRIVCIFTPYVLTIASLVCLILVGLGCTNKSSSTLNDLYFFRADLQNLTTASSDSNSALSSALSAANLDSDTTDKLNSLLDEAEKAMDLKDFYDIGLFGYCDGDVTNDNFKTTNCSKAKAGFWFNPVQVWNLNGTGVDDILPDSLQKDLDTYKQVTKWMFIAYIIAFAATVAELVIGLTAICSRWGSFVTSLVSAVSLIFTVAASVTATVMYVVLKNAFNKALKDYGITGSMGKNMYVTTWLAVAFSLGASLFWLLSSCCCSGKSPHANRRNRAVSAEKAPYTYEPVGSTYAHGAQQPSNVPVDNMRTTAYEPYRHV
ncbi:integral membrane protein [Paecilomyces variotii No. 5]|uniref:Integral membrane protein n=1 Tax=Byssochlamys spectabilis (strain No. 5 / NBRC 109023) TaxID=1356009 RepID=V5FZ18_BYSSN|nr:integral membrane protein [Paecilomyces variotii No. 5]